MNKAFGMAITVVALVIGGAVGKMAVEFLVTPNPPTIEERKEITQEHLNKPETMTRVNTAWQSIEDQAKKDTSDDPDTIKYQKASKDYIEERLNNSSKHEKAGLAAGTVLGAYLINKRDRVEFCAKYGVDATPYAEAIYQKNKQYIDKAMYLLSEIGVTEEIFYEKVSGQYEQVIAMDMKDIKNQLQVDTYSEVCEVLVEYRKEMAEETAMDKVMGSVVAELAAVPDDVFQ